MLGRCLLLLTVLALPRAFPQTPPTATGGIPRSDQDLVIRDRYEQALERNPFQESAFDRVYDAYMLGEGVDTWLNKLAGPEGAAEPASHLILRGRIFARQLRRREAIEALNAARERGESGVALDQLLGQLYYEEGQDDQAIALLSASLDAIESPEDRAKTCRILGNIYLRSGKRDEAVAAWKRMVETSPGDLFALQELAEIYETNRLWDEAVSTWESIVVQTEDDPYRRCQAHRAIGRARVAQERYPDAIAAFEAGLDLVAPGNWLFEDLKTRLVAVYEAMGDLEGLETYLIARIEQNPASLEYQELLAETHRRQGKVDAAGKVLSAVLERAPDRIGAWDQLIRLYDESGRTDALVPIYEQLIARHPEDPDYLRRLGEAQMRAGNAEQALATWKRVAGEDATAADIVLLAEWLERYEFYPEAADTYRRALALQPDREWRLRLASLEFDLGREDEALAAWLAAVAPDDTPVEEIAEIAALLATRGFDAQAQDLYVRAMAQAPDNLDYVLAAARLHGAAGDHAGALPLYTRLADQEENEYFRNSGEQGLLDAYAALGTLDAQRAAWEQEVATQPENTSARLKLARLYARAGNRPGAVALYEACAARDPDNVEIQRRLAEAYRLNRQYDQAITALEGLMDTDPPRAAGYLRDLLDLYARGNQQEKAIAAAEQLVERAPASPEARATLAEVYQRYGEQEKALQQFRNLIQLDSTEPAYFRDFGEALVRAGWLGEAADSFRKMLEVSDPGAARLDAVTRLAGVYGRLGQTPDLVAEFESRVRATPKSLAAYEELAAIHRTAGDRVAAMNAIERARGEVEDHTAFLRLILSEAYDAGDYPKVVATYQELLSLSGEASIHELDRLAEAHARTGNLDEAIAVWEGIGSAHPDDAQAQLLVARAMKEQGLPESATPFVQRALDLEPWNYTLRFQFALDLLNQNQPGEAETQLRRLLEIGAPPAPATGTASTPAASSAPPPATYTRSGAIPRQYIAQPGQGGFGGGFSSGIGGGFSAHVPFTLPTGTRGVGTAAFEAVQIQTLQTLVQIAEQTGTTTALLEEFRKKTEEDPQNVDARYQYLNVCGFANEYGLALEAARALEAIYPDDPDLLWRLVDLQQINEKTEDAIVTARKLAGSPDRETALRASMTLLEMLAAAENDAAVDETVAQVLEAYPDDAQVFLRLAQTLNNLGRNEEAEEYFSRAADMDPQLRIHVNQMLAEIYRSRGELDKARARLVEVLFADSPPSPAPTTPVIRAAQRVYMPQYDGRARSQRNPGNVTRLRGGNFQGIDIQKEQALNQLVQMTLDEASLRPVLDRVAAEAAAYGNAKTPEIAARAAAYLTMYTAWQRNSQGAEAALAALEPVAMAHPADLLLQNLLLYLLEDLGRYDAMDTVYSRLESHPAVRPLDLAQARLHLAMARDDFATVPDSFRKYLQHGGSDRYLGRVVNALESKGAFNPATALLEEALAKSRTPETLVLLAQARSRMNRHDEAIALAGEVWQMQSASSARLQARQPRQRYNTRDLSLPALGLHALQPLWEASEKAGRSDALIDDFKKRLEGQPNSELLHRALAGLYCQIKRIDLAEAQFAQLVVLRPNDTAVKLQYAELQEANGNKEAALKTLEELAEARPGDYRAFELEMQRLYRELNKTEDLAALQDRLVREARSPGDLHELAQRFANEREFGRAAETMERLQQRQPENLLANLQIADFYWQDDQREKAIEKYIAYLTSDTDAFFARSQGLSTIISRFKEAGRLDDLKAMVATDEGKKRTLLALLGAQIDMYENRYAEARARLEPLLGTPEDNEVRALLADIAQREGDLDGAIKYLEQNLLNNGGRDLQRLASLYLQKGDTAGAIQYWKKNAELRGGAQGHAEAVNSLLQAGAYEAAAEYFASVIDKISPADWAYRQLCEPMVQACVEAGHFETLVLDTIFAKENPHTGPLAEQLTNDFQRHPDQALKRLVPIADRFPANLEVQARKAEILEKLGDFQAAAAAMDAVPPSTQEAYPVFERRIRLLGKSGQVDRQKTVLLDRLAGSPDPVSPLIQLAAEVFTTAGDLEGLEALQTRTLAAANPSQRLRIQADFAQATGTSDPRDALRAACEATPVETTLRAYLSYLNAHGYYRDASAYYDELKAKQALASLSPVNADTLAQSLIASGRAGEAWKFLLDSARREENPFNITNRSRELIRLMRDFGISVEPQRALLASLKQQPSLTLNERFYAAAFEAQLGHGDVALDLLDVNLNDYHLKDAIRAIVQEAPPEKRLALAKRGVSGSPEERARLELMLEAAGELIQQAGHKDAIALLDSIEFNDDLATYQPQRGRLYLDAGAPDKAAVDFRAALDRQPENVSLGMALASTLALQGRFSEAMQAWRDAGHNQPGPETTNLATLLVDHHQYSEARSILDACAKHKSRYAEGDVLMARILYETGLEAFITDEMEARFALLDTEAHERFEQAYATFLSDTGLWPQRLNDGPLESRPALAGALLKVALQAQDPGDDAVRAAIVNALQDQAWARTDQVTVCAGLLQQLDQNKAATDHLKDWLDAGQRGPDDVRRIAAQLGRLDPAEAAAVLLRYAAPYPELLQDPAEIVDLVARAGESPAASQLFALLQQASYPDTAKEFNQAALALARGETDTALAQFRTLLDRPDLKEAWLLRMEDLFRSNGAPGDALKTLDRLRRPGAYSADTAALAAARMVMVHADLGQYEEAIQVFAEMLPARRTFVMQARATLLNHAAALPADLADQGLLDLAAAKPDHPRAPFLLALRAALGKARGSQLPPADPVALGLPPLRAHETALWTNLIDTWRVSPPEPCRSWTAMAAPLNEPLAALARGSSGAATQLASWKETAPREVYPCVRLPESAAGVSGGSASHLAVYGIVDIESPDARNITLAHGSDDWSRVWVNGEEVFANAYSRVCLLDQDRIPVTLQPGKNRILVKCGNRFGDWEFALSILENDRGLTVYAPGATADSAPANPQ